MSSQNLKQRRSRIGNFRNTKNSTEDKFRERKESVHLEEEKLETVREKFDLCLRQLIEYEELNIFSRDSNSEGNAISNFLIENEILHQILLQYKKVISEEKESYCSVQARFVSLVGEMNENAMNLNNLLADIEIFYSEMDAEFVNEERFRSKLIEKLNKLNEEMKILSPLIFGKNMECESVLKIANQLSLIYSSIQLEKKQYSKIKKELKKHQHHTLTNNNNNNNANNNDSDNDIYDDNISKYKMTDLKQIENEIRKLRKKKCETMKKLIDKVYGRKYKKNNLKELKLKQVLLHYNESIIDDNKIHLKLESELLEMQCEEFQNELILLEKKKETNQAKQLQLSNAINIYNQNQNESDFNHDFNQNSAKQISRHALTQLHKLQKLERDQRKAMHLMEREIFKIEKSLKEEKEKQKLIKNNIFKKVNKKKKKREKEKCFDLDDNKNKKERKLLEAQFNKNKQLIEEKRKCFNNLKKENEETVLNKSELQRMSHQYQNSIVSHKYLSQNALRKNGEALEFLSEINFLNKEYEIQMDQINNKYREKQTFLKNKFISDFNNKIKKNTKNRQTQIEQESYNIIQERKDKELIDLTQMINEQQIKIKQNLSSQMQSRSRSRYKAAKFCNKSKAVKIKFGKQTIVSSINDIDTNELEVIQKQNDVLRAIKFEWNEDTNKSQHEHQTDVDIGHNIIAQRTDFEQEQDDISTDLSFDANDGQQPDLEINIDANVANYKNLILQINNGNIDICNCLNKQMNVDEDEDDDENNENESNIEDDGYGDIAVQHLKFDNINMVKELLINWTCLAQPNAVK